MIRKAHGGVHSSVPALSCASNLFEMSYFHWAEENMGDFIKLSFLSVTVCPERCWLGIQGHSTELYWKFKVHSHSVLLFLGPVSAYKTVPAEAPLSCFSWCQVLPIGSLGSLVQIESWHQGRNRALDNTGSVCAINDCGNNGLYCVFCACYKL